MTETQLRTLPARKVYRLLARQLFEAAHECGWEDLAPELKNFGLAAELHGEVTNGGLIQYFTNSSGKHYALALRALREIGAVRQESIVMDWLRTLPPHVKADDRSAVGKCVFADPVLASALQEIDREYFAAEAAFFEVIVSYVWRNKNQFIVFHKGGPPSKRGRS